jgi:hypothetical protein
VHGKNINDNTIVQLNQNELKKGNSLIHLVLAKDNQKYVEGFLVKNLERLKEAFIYCIH